MKGVSRLVGASDVTGGRRQIFLSLLCQPGNDIINCWYSLTKGDIVQVDLSDRAKAVYIHTRYCTVIPEMAVAATEPVRDPVYLFG